MTCPACGEVVGKAAEEGGVLVRNRYVLVKGGMVLVACPKCKAEVELKGVKLVLYRSEKS